MEVMEGGYSWIGWYLNPPSDCSPPLVENAGCLRERWMDGQREGIEGERSERGMIVPKKEREKC